MNGASKILTVSYGTFSCTLEGFDDPFNTMKAIAEYFRDLAAEDRYFGAEPPTPDAAMLHRIAEREIQRRVEAKIQENGVVLRASDMAAPAAPAAPATMPAVTPSAAPAPVMPVTVAEAAPAPAPAPVPAPAPSLAPADAQATESVVAKLSRLRSEVAAQPGAVAPVTTMPTVSFAIPDYLEDEHAEVIEAAQDLPASVFEPAPVVEPAPAAEAEPAAVAEDFLPELATPAEVTPVTLAEDAPLPEEMAPATDDAFLAALAKDVTDAAEAVPAAAPETAVDETASDLPDSLMAALADSLAGTKADEALPELAEAVIVEAVAEEIAARAEPVEEFAGLGDLVADSAAAPELVPELAPEPVSADVTSPDMQDAALDAAFERTQDDTLEAAFERSAVEVEELVAEGDDEAAAPSTAPELRPGAAEKLQRARARVIRIRKTDESVIGADAGADIGADAGAAPAAQPPAADAPADAALDEGTPSAAPVTPVRPIRVQRDAQTAPAPLSELTDAEAEPLDTSFEASLSDIFAEVVEETPAAPKSEIPVAPPAAAAAAEAEVVEGLLSAEDEAELMRELAALRQNEEDGPDAAAAAGASAFVLQQEHRKGFDGPSADEALGRLMQQTDSEMQGPETKRRQSAIAHLKAAVAATVAERKVTGDKPADATGVSRLARYRNDLAMVVKSALPGRSGPEEPKDRPAPLVLVSEQRIDKPRTPPAPGPTPTVVASSPAPVQAAPIPSPSVSPVRPRRVSTSGLAMQAAEDSLYDEDDAEEGDVGNLFGDAKGFGDFVEHVGATTLEEILEASAAYLAAVEGRDSFSRPQLMHHVGSVVPAGRFQREDGLRGFGTLLRSGRISKLRRGHFVLSEESPYLAEARKIAG